MTEKRQVDLEVVLQELIDLEVILQELETILSQQTILTTDIIKEIYKSLINDIIHKICTTWINDIDTTIGMQCLWKDYLVKDIPLNTSSSNYIEEALNITDEHDITKIHVEHKQYGTNEIYITVIDNSLIFSTCYRILNDYCTGNTSHW